MDSGGERYVNALDRSDIAPRQALLSQESAYIHQPPIHFVSESTAGMAQMRVVLCLVGLATSAWVKAARTFWRIA